MTTWSLSPEGVGWAVVHDLAALDQPSPGAVRIAAPPALAVELVKHGQLPVLGIGRPEP